MNWINLEKLRAKAAEMPAGFLEEVLAAGTLDGERLYIPRSTYNAIKTKYSPPLLRGAGDLVAKFAQPIARAIDHVTGTNLENCDSCKKRRAKLNAAIPFKATP